MDFKPGDEIKFKVGNEIWEGNVVGFTTIDYERIGTSWIVKVSSGQIPNENQPFDTITVNEQDII